MQRQSLLESSQSGSLHTYKSPSPDQETKKAKNPEDQAAKDTPNPLSEPENPSQAFWWKNRKKVIFQRPFTDEED